MKKLLTVLVAGTGLAACAGEAQSTNEVEDLPPVTIYASRIDDTKDALPAAIAVFTAAEIEASGARDLPELLKKKAGIDIHAMNGNPLLTSIAMRGFGDNAFGRIKVVLDGEELNNVDMNAPNLTRIPLGSVERVEVIHGPSPVLYGDGAVAGVVNVTTDTRDYEKKTKITGKAGSQYTFGGNVQTKGGFEEEGVLYNAAYDYLHSDGYRKRSAYDLHTANAGVRKNFENGSTIGFKANYQNAFYELPGSLTYDQWKHARRTANNHDDWTRAWSYGFGIDSKLKLAEDQWLYLDGNFSHQYRRAKMAGWGTDTEYDYYNYALSPRYVNEKDVFGFGNKFTVGLDLRFDGYHENPRGGASIGNEPEMGMRHGSRNQTPAEARKPPSTGTVMPVTNAARVSSRSHSTQPRRSSASPKRPAGVWAITCSPRGERPPSGVQRYLRERSLTMKPGATALTRTCAGAMYCAKNCVQLAMAALAIA